MEIALIFTVDSAIAAIFVFIVAKQILYWTWLWQLKEYRFDRLLAHLELFPAEKQKLSLFLGYYGFKSFRTPKFTQKATLIIMSSLLFYILFLKPVIDLSLIDSILTFLALYLTIPLTVGIAIDVLNGITSYRKEKIIKRAKEKIQKAPNLLIIGVTGSYGKSSTKELLYEFLSGSKKFSKILKTSANINTPIGIAQTIIDKLENDCQIFIVEMGAYKIGEIRDICGLTPPKIGILTGINEQHLALFGNLHKTAEAKFELIAALPKDGLAVLNSDNSLINEKIKSLNAVDYKNIGKKKEEITQPLAVKNIISYSAIGKADIYADKVKVGRNNLEFEMVYGNEKTRVAAPLAGAQNIYNILAAASVALILGVTASEIAAALKNIAPREKTMREYSGANGAFLIADTYNGNPNGVMAALDYLPVYGGRKIIVFGGIIELGRSSREVHEKIGAKIAERANLAILTNPIFAEYIKKGALEKGMPADNIMTETSKNKILEILNEYAGAEDVILFSGRDGEKILEKLKK